MSPVNHQGKAMINMHPPPPLKANKDSHMIKKSSPSSSSSSSASSSLGIVGPVKPPQRHPVIIYTHSPKIIHTNPKDFMALVQKLTGLSRSEDHPAPRVKQENGGHREENTKKVKINDGSLGDGQIHSCYMPPLFQPPNPNYIPLFAPNSAEFLCANQPFYNYADPFYFPSPNRRNSISTKSTLEVKNEFCGY
ncbi:F16F4.1 PROTEIN-RELATED [Salix purpurea]|uniref:F16F4.1 PROTEIN-RELATED n=1 Tax=Salix purpurea TaxID=77065 RepID=A0A9Q0VK58_SALPP|nr:F16F4.1 PROTEIN-RELATED [Salix purpurea]